MYTQNSSHPGNATAGSAAGADPDKTRQKNNLQREIMMKEMDYKKIFSEKIKLDAEVRKLKNDEAHIKVGLQERQTRLMKLEQDIARSDAELHELRKKFNAS